MITKKHWFSFAKFHLSRSEVQEGWIWSPPKEAASRLVRYDGISCPIFRHCYAHRDEKWGCSLHEVLQFISWAVQMEDFRWKKWGVSQKVNGGIIIPGQKNLSWKLPQHPRSIPELRFRNLKPPSIPIQESHVRSTRRRSGGTWVATTYGRRSTDHEGLHLSHRPFSHSLNSLSKASQKSDMEVQTSCLKNGWNRNWCYFYDWPLLNKIINLNGRSSQNNRWLAKLSIIGFIFRICFWGRIPFEITLKYVKMMQPIAL